MAGAVIKFFFIQVNLPLVLLGREPTDMQEDLVGNGVFLRFHMPPVVVRGGITFDKFFQVSRDDLFGSFQRSCPWTVLYMNTHLSEIFSICHPDKHMGNPEFVFRLKKLGKGERFFFDAFKIIDIARCSFQENGFCWFVVKNIPFNLPLVLEVHCAQPAFIYPGF